MSQTTTQPATLTLKTKDGRTKQVKHLDPVWCAMEGRRVRFGRVEPDGMVEVCDNDGRVLPHLRHPASLFAY